MTNKQLVDKLVSVGFTEADAKVRVKAVTEAAKSLMKGETDKAIDGVVTTKIKQLARMTKDVKMFDVVCVAAGDIRDFNEYTVNLQLEAYKEDPTQAIAEGLVKLVEGDPVALDTKKFFDKEGKMKNNNFGKPIKVQMKREATFIYDDDFIRAYGNVDITPGNRYSVFGKVSASGTLNMKPVPPAIPRGEVTPTEMWDMIDKVGASSDTTVQLCDVSDQDKSTFVVIRGTVQASIETSNEGAMLILDDDDIGTEPVACFANTTAMIEQVLQIVEGTEACIMGSIGKQKDNDTEEIKTNVSALGVVINPLTVGDPTVMSELDSVLYK